MRIPKMDVLLVEDFDVLKRPEIEVAIDSMKSDDDDLMLIKMILN